MKRTSRPKIDSVKHFRQEYRSLLEDINNNICELAQYERVEMEKPSVEIIEKLNRLKIHRKKLTDMLRLFHDVNDEEWAWVRSDAQEIYQAARMEWLKAVDEMTST